jgi:hypothetical protein
VPNVDVTYEEMQAAARRLQVPVIRLRAATAVAAVVVVALPYVQSGTHGRNGTSACSPHAGYDRGQRVVGRVHSRHRGRPRLREGRQRPQGRRHVQGQEVQYRWKVR